MEIDFIFVKKIYLNEKLNKKINLKFIFKNNIKLLKFKKLFYLF